MPFRAYTPFSQGLDYEKGSVNCCCCVNALPGLYPIYTQFIRCNCGKVYCVNALPGLYPIYTLTAQYVGEYIMLCVNALPGLYSIFTNYDSNIIKRF